MRRQILLTGASSGIGRAAALRLAALGHAVVPISRDAVRTAEVAAAIGAEPVLMDLLDLGDVRRAAIRLLGLSDRIDVLALHAGAVFANRIVTRDGVEATMQTNHLGHFLLERLLHERLVADRSLVVFTGSLAVHAGTLRSTRPDRSDVPYGLLGAYGDSKLAALLFARELVRRSRGTGTIAVVFHPGVSNTQITIPVGLMPTRLLTTTHDLLARMPGVRTPERSADTLVRLAGSPPQRGIQAHYLGPTGRDAVLPRRASDRRLAARIWERSEQLVGL